MPLELLLILVVGGIAGIALLTHLAGLSRPKQLSDTNARVEWARHYPDDTVQSLRITRDALAALILTEQGSGLLWVMGADTVGRHLLDFDLIDDTNGLTVAFHDYTAPAVHLRLDAEERYIWKTMITPQ